MVPAVENQRWRQQAACRDMDQSLFFPERGQNVVKARIACRSCPVSSQCLEYGLAMQTADDDFGVWGDTTPHERRGMRRFA